LTPDNTPVWNHAALIAAAIAALSGWGLIHHGKAVLHSGVGIADGGGWTVILLVETMLFLVGINVALA
jgi:hypothetical protein